MLSDKINRNHLEICVGLLHHGKQYKCYVCMSVDLSVIHISNNRFWLYERKKEWKGDRAGEEARDEFSGLH